MFLRILFILLLTLSGLPGCAKKNPDDNRASNVRNDATSELEMLRPESGGEMVLIPTGQFTMGDAEGRPDETPHEVSVSSFYMDKYAVTQEIYENIAGTNPSKRKAPDNPVESTQWRDAVRFCNKCSVWEGLTPCYDLETWQCNFAADGYRLPTEAEWEYACRAGSQQKYFFGNDPSKLPDYAWCKPLSRGRPRPVGQRRPNAWGLYDMHGNVWQWCNDYYSKSWFVESPRENPRGPETGKKRVLRGGAWNSPAEKCRAAYRSHEFPVFTDACFGADSYGFRRVRNVGNSARERQTLAQANKGETKPTGADNAALDKSTDSANQPVASPVAETATAEITLEGTIDAERLRGTIVFVSDRGESLDIWAIHPTGKGLKQLTKDSYPDADPRFSPDGQQIMYTTLRDGFPEVWKMDHDGASPEHITDGAQAAWAPDGKSIVFIRDDQTFIKDLASGRDRLVTPDSWQRCGVPTFSPNGKKVAVASRHLESIGIFIFSADGKAHSQLQTEDACCTPQWSQDGERMIFQTVKGHIHEIATSGEDEEQLTFGADIQHDPRYSPDGTMIVFCRAPIAEGPWQLCITDLESDDLDFIQITNKRSNSHPDWHASE